MATWRFNMRSGYDGEESDNEDTPNETSGLVRQLGDLFSCAEEETVDYRPNPWKIAKLNAHTRASRRNEEPPRLDHSFHGAGDQEASRPQRANGSLRESISAALRRNNVAPASGLAEPSSLQSYNTRRIIPNLPKNYEDLSEMEEVKSLDQRQRVPSAYIQQDSLVRHALHEQQDSDVYIPGLDTHNQATPALTWDNPSSDGPTVQNSYPFPAMNVPGNGYGADDFFEDEFACGYPLPPMQSFVETSPRHVSSPGVAGDADPKYPYSPPEPSPTVQLIAEYVTGIGSNSRPTIKHDVSLVHNGGYLDVAPVNNYGHIQPAYEHEQSPTFAHSPPASPPLNSRSHVGRISTPVRDHRSTPDRVVIRKTRCEPVTPLQRTRWTDLGEQPVWSTLPTRSKKNKQVHSPMASTRFRLPKTFLGSSSSPATEPAPARSWYKPPPRKWSLNQDEEDQPRWKVTRIG